MIRKRSSNQQSVSDLSFFTLKNATTAYKKAKIDAWKLHSIDPDAFMAFELNFKENLVNFSDLYYLSCLLKYFVYNYIKKNK